MFYAGRGGMRRKVVGPRDQAWAALTRRGDQGGDGGFMTPLLRPSRTTTADDDAPMRSCVAPAGIDGENHACREEDVSDAQHPDRPQGDPEKIADCITEEEKTDHDHLGGSLGLAGGVGGQDGAVAEGELPQPGDEEIAGDEKDGRPRRDVMRPGQTDERRGDEHLVGQRIHEAAEVGLAGQPAGEDAVQVVAEDREPEGHDGHGGTPRHAALAGYDKDNREKEAQDGELIGESHGERGKMAKGQPRDKAATLAERLYFAVVDRKQKGERRFRRGRLPDDPKRYFERSFEYPVQYLTTLEIRPAGEPRKKL